MSQRKKPKKIIPPTKLPDDFKIGDILNAPVRKKDLKRVVDGTGCLHCGSVRIISKGEIKVFRGQRMKPYHCHECGQDFYKSE
jgi:hypothetical protein